MNNTQTVWTLIAVQAPLYALVSYSVKLLVDTRVALARIETKIDDHVHDDRAHVQP